jgi:hypothetical protein
MNEQENKNPDSQEQADIKSAKVQPALRPWVKPEFERISMKEALAGVTAGTTDGATGIS